MQNEVIYMTVGERIKSRRKQLGVSADVLADHIGVSRATIFRYENGSIEKLPMTCLEPIAKALYTSVEYLMGWTDDPNPTLTTGKSTIKRMRITTEEDELLSLFRRVTEQGQAVILGNARMIASMDEYQKPFVIEKPKKRFGYYPTGGQK